MKLPKSGLTPTEAALESLKAYSRSGSGYAAQPPSAPAAADEPTEPIKKPEKSMLGYIGGKTLSGIAAVGNLLDTPSSMVRDALAGENPFDQLADPLGYNAAENRVEGRELARQYGLARKDQDNWGNFIGGMALEFALDPLTYVGIGALNRAGKAMAAAGVSKTDGIMKHLAKKGKLATGQKGVKVKTRAGGMKARQKRLTPSDVFNAMDDIAQDAADEVATDKNLLDELQEATGAKVDFDTEIKSQKEYDILYAKGDIDPRKIYIVDSPTAQDASGLLAKRNNETLKDVTAKLQNAYKEKFGSLGTNAKTVKSPETLRRDYELYYKKKYKSDPFADDSYNKPLRSTVQFGVPGSERLRVTKNIPDVEGAKQRWIKRNTVDEAAEELASETAKRTATEAAEEVATKAADTTAANTGKFTAKLIKNNAPLAAGITRLATEATVVFGDEGSDAWLPGLVEYTKRKYKTADEQNQFLGQISLEEMTQKEAVEFAARMNGGNKGSIDDLAQAVFHGTPQKLEPEQLVRMPDGTEQYMPLAEEVPEGAEQIAQFPMGRFSTSKVGSGVGNQSYGWGLYFAEDKRVADYYREASSRKRRLTQKPKPGADATYDGQELGDVENPLLREMLYRGKGSSIRVQKEITRERNRLNKLISEGASQEELSAAKEQLKQIDAIEFDPKKFKRKKTEDPGSVLEVDLKPEEDEYLIWDKPLAEQSDKVKKIIQELTQEPEFSGFLPELLSSKISASRAYEEMAVRLGGAKKASLSLRDRGIRGVKYLDRSSRRDGGKGNHNYVIFDDADIEITESFAQKSNKPGKYKGSIDNLAQAVFPELPKTDFYLKTERLLDSGKIGGKVGKDQFKATAKKAGVKDEEIEDLLIDELFEDGKPKTKEEIREWINANRVDLEIRQDNKYSDYSVPGGDPGTYREILIKGNSIPNAEEVKALVGRGEATLEESNGAWAVVATNPGGFVNFTDDYFLPGEVLGSGASKDQAIRDAAKYISKSGKEKFPGGHFKDKDILVHLRMDDVELPNGKKSLRIQEVQSDLHQSGKKAGYRSEAIPQSELTMQAVEGFPDGTKNWRLIKRDKKGKAETLALINASNADKAYQSYRKGLVPDIPFKKSWSALGLKQAIKTAVDGGYDSIMIVKGEDIADAVGGPAEALSTFYDTILNKEMRKLTKKWGSFEGVKDPKKKFSVYGKYEGYGQFDTLEEAKKFAESKAGKEKALWNRGDEGWIFLNESDLSIAPSGGMGRDAQVFKISDKMKKEVMEEGQPLYQKSNKPGKYKGFVNFGQDGKMIIRGVKGSADISTLMHETGHIFRRHLDEDLMDRAEKEIAALLKDPERLRVAAPDIDVANAKLKHEDGTWTREADEVFARLYERYAADGVAPAGLKGAFEKIKEMMLAVYRTMISGKKGKDEISGGDIPEGLRKVFDDMLTAPKPGPKAAANSSSAANAAGRFVAGAEELELKNAIQGLKDKYPGDTMPDNLAATLAQSEKTLEALRSERTLEAIEEADFATLVEQYGKNTGALEGISRKELVAIAGKLGIAVEKKVGKPKLKKAIESKLSGDAATAAKNTGDAPVDAVDDAIEQSADDFTESYSAAEIDEEADEIAAAAREADEAFDASVADDDIGKTAKFEDEKLRNRRLLAEAEEAETVEEILEIYRDNKDTGFIEKATRKSLKPIAKKIGVEKHYDLNVDPLRKATKEKLDELLKQGDATSKKAAADLSDSKAGQSGLTTTKPAVGTASNPIFESAKRAGTMISDAAQLVAREAPRAAARAENATKQVDNIAGYLQAPQRALQDTPAAEVAAGDPGFYLRQRAKGKARSMEDRPATGAIDQGLQGEARALEGTPSTSGLDFYSKPGTKGKPRSVENQVPTGTIDQGLLDDMKALEEAAAKARAAREADRAAREMGSTRSLKGAADARAVREAADQTPTKTGESNAVEAESSVSDGSTGTSASNVGGNADVQTPSETAVAKMTNAARPADGGRPTPANTAAARGDAPDVDAADAAEEAAKKAEAEDAQYIAKQIPNRQISQLKKSMELKPRTQDVTPRDVFNEAVKKLGKVFKGGGRLKNAEVSVIEDKVRDVLLENDEIRGLLGSDIPKETAVDIASKDDLQTLNPLQREAYDYYGKANKGYKKSIIQRLKDRAARSDAGRKFDKDSDYISEGANRHIQKQLDERFGAGMKEVEIGTPEEIKRLKKEGKTVPTEMKSKLEIFRDEVASPENPNPTNEDLIKAFGQFLNSPKAVQTVVRNAKQLATESIRGRGRVGEITASVLRDEGLDKFESLVGVEVKPEDSQAVFDALGNTSEKLKLNLEEAKAGKSKGEIKKAEAAIRNHGWLEKRFYSGVKDGKQEATLQSIAEESGFDKSTVKRGIESAVKILGKEYQLLTGESVEATRNGEYFGQLDRRFEDASEAIDRAFARRLLKSKFEDVLVNFRGIVEDPGVSEKLSSAWETGSSVLHALPGMRLMAAIFDASTFGAQTEKGQEIARMRWEAMQRATTEVRQLISSAVYQISKSGILDERAIAKAQKISREEAREIVNERNREIVRYLEKRKTADELLRDGETRRLNKELFKGTSDRNLSDLEIQLNTFAEILDDRLIKEIDAGLTTSELIDDFVSYFPRIQHRPNRPLLKSTIGDSIFKADIDAAKSRSIELKNIVGGREVLDRLSLDRDISGTLHVWKPNKAKPVKDPDALENAYKIVSSEKYIDDILRKDEIEALRNAPNSKMGKKAEEKLRGIATWAYSLDPAYAMDQMPYYGRNFLYDFAHRVSEGIAKSAMAMAGLDLIARSVAKNGKIGRELYTVLEAAKLDTNQAYRRVIRAKGDIEDYEDYADIYVQSLKEKADDALDGLAVDAEQEVAIKKIGDEYYIRTDDLKGADDSAYKMRKPATDADIEKAANLAKQYTKRKSDYFVDDTTAEELKRVVKSWSSPPETRKLLQWANKALQIFKYNVTVTAPAFHTRNFISGQIQNMFYNAYGLGAIKSLAHAFNLRREEAPKGFAKHIGEDVLEANGIATKTGSNVDREAAMWIRKLAFKYGVIGDKQGYAVEDLGEALSGVASQMPGAEVRPNLGGVFREANKEGSKINRVLQRFNPLNQRGMPVPRKMIDDTGGSTKETLGFVPIEESKFTLGRAGEDLSLAVEDVNRITPFIELIRKGVAPDEAARQVHKIQIDYSSLSETEKGIRQIFPFYTFSSRMVPMVYNDILRRPTGAQAMAIRANARAQDPESNAPDYLRRGTTIPWGRGPDGSDRYISGLGLAYEDAMSFAPLLQGDVGATAGELYSRLRPELQAFGELAFGRSAFFDRPLEDLDPPAGRLLSNLSGAERDGNAEPFISQGAEFLLSKSPAARYIGTANKALDERKNPLYRALNTLTGFKVTDVSPEAQSRVALDRAVEAQKNLGAREASFVYMPEWRKKRLTPEQLESYEGVREFMRQVNKETRERKKAAESLKAGTLQNDEG